MHSFWLACRQLGLPLRPPARKQDLKALEQRWGAPLPAELRAALLEHDGADLDALSEQDAFHPIVPLSAQGMLEALDGHREMLESGEAQILDGLCLPIAVQDAVNHVVLFRDPALGGRVGLWSTPSIFLELWSLDLERFAAAWQGMWTEPDTYTFNLTLDYPAPQPLAGDEAAAEHGLQLFRQLPQGDLRGLFYLNLAAQLWPAERAAELHAGVPRARTAPPLSPQQVVREVFKARGLWPLNRRQG